MTEQETWQFVRLLPSLTRKVGRKMTMGYYDFQGFEVELPTEIGNRIIADHAAPIKSEQGGGYVDEENRTRR